MKHFKKIILLVLSVQILSCAERTKNHITTFPQEINKDTGLREIKLRRSDCIDTAYEHIKSRCDVSEDVQINKDNEVVDVDVNEQTAWVNSAGKATVANPTIQIDEKNDRVIVNVTHRKYSSKAAQITESEYSFAGDLNSYRNKWPSTRNPYLYLDKKSGGKDFVKSMIYCSDAPVCHDIYVLFSFKTTNDNGEEELGSRIFNIDQRELPLENNDFIPGKAEVTQLDIEIEPINLPEIVQFEDSKSEESVSKNVDEDLAIDNTEAEVNGHLEEDISDPATADIFDNKLNPVLPYDESNHLCEEFKNGECPRKIFNPIQNQTREMYFKFMRSIGAKPTANLPNQGQVIIPDDQLYRAKKKRERESNKEEQVDPKIENRDSDKIQILEEGPLIEQKETQDSTLKSSERPKPKPDNLVEKKRQIKSELEFRFLESVDGKFTYDMAECEDMLVELRNGQFNQAKRFYWDGSLKNATYFQDLIGNIAIRKGDKNEHYTSGISHLVANFSACMLKQRYKDTAHVEVHDFSLKEGGKIGTHKSHRNGLDFDVSYPHFNGKTRAFDDFRKSKDPRRIEMAIDYARILLATNRIHILFTLNSIKRKFCTHLKSIGKFEQYGDLIDRHLYHASYHHNHYHVRMKCNEQNYECNPQDPLYRPTCK